MAPLRCQKQFPLADARPSEKPVDRRALPPVRCDVCDVPWWAIGGKGRPRSITTGWLIGRERHFRSRSLCRIYRRASACNSSRNSTGAIELKRMAHFQGDRASIGRIVRTVLLSAPRIGPPTQSLSHLGVAEDKRRPTRPLTVKAPHILLNEIKASALGERQVGGKVHCRGLAAPIAFPGVRTGLSAAARVLFTSKGAADFRSGR